MKRFFLSLVLVAVGMTQAFAGLKVVGDTNGFTFGDAGGTITLSLVADTTDVMNVNTIGGVGATPFSFAFTGGPGAVPTIDSITPTAPFVSFLGGFSTFPAPPIDVMVGTPVEFATVAFTVNGLGNFDLSLVDALEVYNDGGTALLDTPLVGAVSGATVAVPEPSSFLFLGLVGGGVAGVQAWRRRKSEATEEEAVEA